jgi:hypothetical protein
MVWLPQWSGAGVYVKGALVEVVRLHFAERRGPGAAPASASAPAEQSGASDAAAKSASGAATAAQQQAAPAPEQPPGAQAANNGAL